MAQKDLQSVGVLRAAGAMGLATFFSRIAGLLREQVFAYLFGASHATDAFNVAFRIPNLLRDLFAEGAMSAALVPTFTRVRAQEGEARAWRVAGLVFRTLFWMAAIISVVGIFAAPRLVSLYASSYQTVPGKWELTVDLTRIMYPFFPLVVLAAAFMGVLNACGRFFMPAFASALFNLTSISLGTALAVILPRWGYPAILGMAYGVVAGGWVQALCQLPQLRRAGYHWQPRQSQAAHEPVWWRDPALRRVLQLMIPGMVGLAATQVNVLVNTILATSQQPGAVSWLNYAFRLMQFPIGIFGVSLAAATLPRISAQWVAQDYVGTVQTLETSIKRIFAVNLPASAGLSFLGFPIIAFLFQYGRFSASDTAATAAALAAYAFGLTAYSVVKVLVPACYAFGNTRLPVYSSVLTVILTVALNLALIDRLGYVGLALGTSLAAFFNAGLLFVFMQKLLRRHSAAFHLWGLFRSFFLNAMLACIMGAACGIAMKLLDSGWPEPMESSKFALLSMRGIKLGAVGFEAILVLWVLAKLFRIPETLEAIDLFTNRVKKKLSRRVN